jgi:uncharacterized protein
MRTVYADTAYWAALIDPEDNWHANALDAAKTIGSAHILTSELVLVELLNMFSKWPKKRPVVSQFVEAVLEKPTITVISSNPELFHAALKLYRQSADKRWSLVDCASFEIMKSRNIIEALTTDRHFEQAGLVALLRK